MRFGGGLLLVTAPFFRDVEAVLHRELAGYQVAQGVISLLRCPAKPAQPFAGKPEWPVGAVAVATAAEMQGAVVLGYFLAGNQTRRIDGSVVPAVFSDPEIEDVPKGIDVLAPTADPRAFVLDVIDGTKHIRIYVPNGEVSERGDIVYANGEPIGYDVTITCYPVNGVVLTKFSDDANWGYS